MYLDKKMKKLLTSILIGLLLLLPTQVASAATENVSVGVFLLNWLDDTHQDTTVEVAYNNMFTETRSVKAFFEDTSYGKVTLSGDVFGWYTVNYNKADSYCNEFAWRNDTNAQAIAEGHDPASYDVRIYVWDEGGCGYTGKTEGTNIYIGVVGSSLYGSIISHELGHYFGVGHANTYTCQDKYGNQVSLPLNRGDTCTQNTYQDAYDVMGNSSYATMNAIHRTMLGWLPPENTQIVESAGTYTILPLEWKTSGVQQLEVHQVAKGRDNPLAFCLEVRQSYGWDQFNETSSYGIPWAVNGIHIHYAPNCHQGWSFGSNNTFMIDTTPYVNTYPGAARFDFPLPVGQTLSGTGVNIKTLSIGPNGATVQISYPKGNTR